MLCQGASVCSSRLEDCTNGVDDDGDGDADCADEDCWNRLRPGLETGDGPIDCATDCICWEDCLNDVDDDGDGNTDCEDPKCSTSSLCQN